MHTYVFPVQAGWMAVAWSSKGISVLVLPQNKKQEASAELSRRLINWGYRTGDNLASSKIPRNFPFLLEKMIDDYFYGKPVVFDIPVDLSWCNSFQKQVLLTVQKIHYGEVRSYSEVAAEAGYPNAARAVGQTLAVNRTPLIIPCHRVIKKNGSVGGFSGGCELKKYLLTLEGPNLSLFLF